jgi:coenzyme F420-reducing hydrogenase beta subunit
MQEDREGFLQPKIDTKLCIQCHKCEKVCPILNPITIPDDFETKAYAAINKDDEVRAQSSSGGVFFPLAQWVINQGGVVFGARWNDKWEGVHDYAEDIEGVKAFMRSKYVQSVVGDTLKQAKAFLEAGRWVLYSGTPCQIGGLKAYLGKEYDKLVTVDLICHGVPSPGVWRSYLKDYVGNDQILSINFRDKSEGWLGFQFFTTTTTTTTTTRRDKQMDNPYFRGFLLNVYLRNSCYDCRFRQYHRASDITIADYWGVNEVCPEMHDDKGTSIVFAHSETGSKILREISTGMRIIEQEKSIAMMRNQGMEYNESKPKSREFYLFIHRLLGFRKSEFAISKDSLLKRIIRKIKRLLHF